jgi:hypothetical protein
MNLPGGFGRGDASGAEKEALFSALLVVLGAMHRAGMVGQSLRLTDAPPPPFGEGATGKFVGVWQAVVGATIDRSFGPKTRAATEAWSEKTGFGRRSSVNEAMWCLGVGTTVGFIDGAVVLPSGERVELAPLVAQVKTLLGQ